MNKLAAISFDKINPQLAADLEKVFGKAPSFVDMQNALFDQVESINQRTMGKLAKEHWQPLTVKLHVPGETVKMSDGTEYVVAEDGSWHKIKEKGGE